VYIMIDCMYVSVGVVGRWRRREGGEEGEERHIHIDFNSLLNDETKDVYEE